MAVAYGFIRYREAPNPNPARTEPVLLLEAWNALHDSEMGPDEWDGTKGGGVLRNIPLDNGWNLVKIRARAELLQALAANADVLRIPNKTSLDQTLADLTTAQRNALRDFMELQLLIPRADWQAVLGTNLGTRTLRQVLAFITGRGRKRRRYVQGTGYVWDGAVEPRLLPDAIEAV